MKLKLLLLTLMLSTALLAQNYTISGRISEVDDKNEGLIGANVMYSESSGTVANIEGDYKLELPAGKYTLRFSYVGYEAIEKEVNLNSNMILNVQLSSSVMMKEILVVADVAIARETPVAFSTLSPKTLEENLAAQDIPMVLNSTPGVYATNEGGGDGDAQVTIRGFDSRNVGVLLDGVPVNDMENGHVYWSNWFGLDAVTRSMQVQRGLGASKLALPSVGGTINIITKGMDSKKGGNFKQEFGPDGYLRSTFGYNSGVVMNGWNFSVAGSYKQGDGWVDQLSSQGAFYYAKVDKKLGDHIVSLSAYGAPQKHGQRSYKLPIAVYDSAYAEELDINLSYNHNMTDGERDEVDDNRENAVGGVDQGVRYNQHWGYLSRNKDNPNAASEPLIERLNFYHKPQITLKDIWNVSDRLYMSNIAYLSIGRGGGTSDFSTLSPTGPDGLKDYQTVYNKNINNV
ncbi:MAG: TonB-dependent receptor, partial [Bacteroidales bacterium]|nr:TonB-dependent receptor [Bacteroidales bacterium]